MKGNAVSSLLEPDDWLNVPIDLDAEPLDANVDHEADVLAGVDDGDVEP